MCERKLANYSKCSCLTYLIKRCATAERNGFDCIYPFPPLSPPDSISPKKKDKNTTRTRTKTTTNPHPEIALPIPSNSQSETQERAGSKSASSPNQSLPPKNDQKITNPQTTPEYKLPGLCGFHGDEIDEDKAWIQEYKDGRLVDVMWLGVRIKKSKERMREKDERLKRERYGERVREGEWDLVLETCGGERW